MGLVVNIPGFEGRILTVKGGLWTGTKLYVNGVKLPREGGKYILRDNSGRTVEIKFKYDLGSIIDGMPYIELENGDVIETIKPLTTAQYIWSALPLLMLFMGGLVGGFIGIPAVHLNAKIFHLKWHPILKYVLTGIITLLFLIIWLMIMVIINRRFKI
jgi:hypothetical protein